MHLDKYFENLFCKEEKKILQDFVFSLAIFLPKIRERTHANAADNNTIKVEE